MSQLNKNQLASNNKPLPNWDLLSPLNLNELASISKIQSSTLEQTIPINLIKRTNLIESRPLTPNLHSNLNLPSNNNSNLLLKKSSYLNLNSIISISNNSTRPNSSLSQNNNNNNNNRNNSLPNESLEILEPIITTQQFFDWFTKVELSIERSQEEIFRNYLTELDEYIDSTDLILEQLDHARSLLSEMDANYKYVEENSRALQLACENMLDEQKHLSEVAEAIGARLEYFRELESATKTLNLPGEALVLQDDFLNMLDRLDVCLEYLKANRDFKDAEIYLIRFQQCLTRSMTLIKMYFVTIIRKLTNEVFEKMAGKELSETAINTLLYQKFSNVSETLRVLVFELEKRGRLEPDEYGSLLQECYATWFGSRMNLLAGTLSEEVRRMNPGSTDLIKLARAGCNHLRAVSMSEWSLFKELFSTGETEIYQFLESLCDYLYDSLRPRILHEPKLEVLCELCTVLTAMMALDTESGVDGDDSDDDEREIPSSPILNDFRSSNQQNNNSRSGQNIIIIPAQSKAPLGRLRFSILLQTILQDSQTRLVFRAQYVLQSEVLNYLPNLEGEDLNYPEKLLEKGVGGLELWTDEERKKEVEVGGFRVPRDEVMKTWYPTLRKTVWVLSKLNTYVNTAIFEDFAGEAVAQCRRSLSAASIQLSSKPGGSKIDGQLFLIRHLLLLKEMIRSVDMVQIERAADFSTVTDALFNLLKNTSVIFNPNAFFELASKGMPTFAETMTDAKTDLDTALKKACEDLISDSSSRISSPLRIFLDQCTAYLSSPTSTTISINQPQGKDLPSQKWATSEAVSKLHDTFWESLEIETRGVVEKLRIYLYDEGTIGVLLPPLLAEILDTYTTFYNLTRSEYGFATSSSLKTPAEISAKMEAVTIR